MAYTVLARRYRSRSFDEVVGQEPIARTLQNAIATNRVAHAYLFCGTRGVGKTSMARIFAKALCCPGDQPKEAAEAIMAGRDIDVIEIDGASNRGVDEARDLIANSIYRPMRGPYKIYIIDEVHMLTREAFNALLKTMEEPPEHVKFILCTTEPAKVLPTIQSRCQRFDFRNISTARIVEHLQDVLKRESVEAEPEMLHQVARLADGSMRDALSVLERLLAAGEKRLTLRLLEDLLGLPERQLVGAILDSCADASPAGALKAVDDLLTRGISGEQVLTSLMDRVRDLLLIATCGVDSPLVDLSDAARAEEARRASRWAPQALVHMISVCEAAHRVLRSSPAPRAVLDAALVRLAMTDALVDAAATLQSLRAEGPSPGGPAPKKR